MYISYVMNNRTEYLFEILSPLLAFFYVLIVNSSSKEVLYNSIQKIGLIKG